MQMFDSPRSVLHALVPMGLGTGDVESLTSYFCRLAYSHGMTARNLAVWVLEHFEQPIPDDYRWFRRSFSGVTIETEQWASWLSELTGVENLDQLSMSPWRAAISTPELMSASDRWCPCCLKEDIESGAFPYLRLKWDLAPVTACLNHKVELVCTCPHCGKSNVRNRASMVVVGYCTSCGGFLGDGEEAASANPEGLWVSRQTGLILANPQRCEDVTKLLETIIERMEAGNVAAFAKRLGLSKTGVWHWVQKGGLPSLPAWLKIALNGGIGLDRLFAGELVAWEPPTASVQLSLQLPASSRQGVQSRKLDWSAIRVQLRAMLEEENPITLVEASQRTGVECKQLYLRATTEARAIVDRYRRNQAAKRITLESRLQAQVGQLIQDRRDEGYSGISAREVWQEVDADLRSVRHSYRVISTAVAKNMWTLNLK